MTLAPKIKVSKADFCWSHFMFLFSFKINNPFITAVFCSKHLTWRKINLGEKTVTNWNMESCDDFAKFECEKMKQRLETDWFLEIWARASWRVAEPCEKYNVFWDWQWRLLHRKARFVSKSNGLLRWCRPVIEAIARLSLREELNKNYSTKLQLPIRNSRYHFQYFVTLSTSNHFLLISCLIDNHLFYFIVYFFFFHNFTTFQCLHPINCPFKNFSACLIQVWLCKHCH